MKQVLIILTLCAAAAAARGDYYTWTCDDGVPQRSDHLPSDAAPCGHRQYRDDGTLIHIEPSQREKEAEQDRNEDERARRREAEEQARQDERWLLLYGTPEEADEMRKRRIAAENQAIRGLHEQVARLQQNLRKAEQNARDFERDGQDVPPTVYANIEKLEQRIAETEELVTQRQRKIDEINTEFDKIVARLKVLVGESTSPARSGSRQ